MKLFNKAIRVVKSCETIDQIRVARRYIQLARVRLAWHQQTALETILNYKLDTLIPD